MAGKETVKGIGCLAVGAALFLGYSWLEQRKQHQFEPAVIETMKSVSGARMVSSFKSGAIINPVSWFWPARTRMVYARLDTSAPDRRFYIMSFGADEKEPTIWLTSVDCRAQSHVDYFPAESGDRGEVARNALGEPTKAPNGSEFRRVDTGVEMPSEEMKALCDDG